MLNREAKLLRAYISLCNKKVLMVQRPSKHMVVHLASVSNGIQSRRCYSHGKNGQVEILSEDEPKIRSDDKDLSLGRKTSSKHDQTGVAVEEVKTLAHAVLEEAVKVDKMCMSIPVRSVERVIHLLLSEGFNMEQVKELLMKKTGLITSRRLKQVLHLLKRYDFQASDIFKILMTVQDLSLLQKDQMNNLYDTLLRAGFSDMHLQDVIMKEPRLLILDSKYILERVTLMKQYFKKDDVLGIVRQTPDVLLANWDDILGKFNYVFGEMKVSQRQMVTANLFSYSLEHVRNRHVFLLRAGFFTEDKHLRCNNPILKDIIGTSDIQFAKQFGGMHEAEYKTFCKLQAKFEMGKGNIETDSE
ncbi:transcription termination factor 4, mitochondrial-like [Haliotis asinina]|uniref:transcription termination factor 4, mitochondrial-like n=1 Tax=Haliotis asinina TaxID=109174 RepID=UPI0035322C75